MAAQNFKLVMRSGPMPGKVFELIQGEITIGRDINNNIVINDAEISRKHARLISQAGSYMIEDLGSTNGTFVDGQRLMGPHLLRHGELIGMGENVSLAFETPQPDMAVTRVTGATISPATPAVQQMPPTTPAYAPAPAPPPSPYQPFEEPYGGGVPPGPVEPAYTPQPQGYYQELYEEPRGSRTWLFVGAGCLVVMLCVLVTAAVAFDYLDLYCTGPFEQFFNCR
jgi:pSer/pThr/pTyr-binding forkhead associated (FHA) protein